MRCNECKKHDKYLIRVAEGIKFANDPDSLWRYSTYADGRIEEKYLCPPCLFIQLGISGAARAPKGYYEVKPE